MINSVDKLNEKEDEKKINMGNNKNIRENNENA